MGRPTSRGCEGTESADGVLQIVPSPYCHLAERERRSCKTASLLQLTTGANRRPLPCLMCGFLAGFLDVRLGDIFVRYSEFLHGLLEIGIFQLFWWNACVRFDCLSILSRHLLRADCHHPADKHHSAASLTTPSSPSWPTPRPRPASSSRHRRTSSLFRGESSFTHKAQSSSTTYWVHRPNPVHLAGTTAGANPPVERRSRNVAGNQSRFFSWGRHGGGVAQRLGSVRDNAAPLDGAASIEREIIRRFRLSGQPAHRQLGPPGPRSRFPKLGNTA
jgi:hypothetical protein